MYTCTRDCDACHTRIRRMSHAFTVELVAGLYCSCNTGGSFGPFCDEVNITETSIINKCLPKFNSGPKNGIVFELDEHQKSMRFAVLIFMTGYINCMMMILLYVCYQHLRYM